MDKTNIRLQLYPEKLADKIYKLKVYGYEQFEIYLIDTFPLIEHLDVLNLTEERIKEYTVTENYDPTCSGRCKQFEGTNIIIVCIQEESLINKITTACHEFNHCAHRILESKGEEFEFTKYEESHCMMQDYLLEAYLHIHLMNENYETLYENHDLLWFKVVTNK